MSRKFSLAYLTIPGTGVVEHIRIAAEAGYDMVSLRTIPMHLPNEPLFIMEKDAALFNATKAALREYGLGLNDIELARVRGDLHIEEYKPAFEKGAELGARNVLSSIWCKDKPYIYEQFGRICDMAAEYDMTVNLEFVTFAGVTDVREALDVLHTVARPNARLMVDTLHAHRSRVTAAELAAVPRELFGFIHLCDGPGPIPALDDPSMIGVAREGRLYIGAGGVDIAGMLKAMPANDVSIELPNSAEMSARGAAGHAAECLRSAKAYFAAHNID
ncbi:MAG: TIM barrel protein [Bacillota bacterium]|nr:TIM barrel protein [Bacillota bacterium]